jgi:hypothetical protein
MHRRCSYLISLLTIIFLWAVNPQSVVALLAATSTTPAGPLSTKPPMAVGTPQPANGIIAPFDGAILQGTVAITGSASDPWTLEFAYVDNSIGTWFLLSQSGQPVSNARLATWDTSAVTDGLYYLRLSVNLDGRSQEFTVKVQVNNTAPIQTGTPTAAVMVTPTASASPTTTVITKVIANGTAMPAGTKSGMSTSALPGLTLPTIEVTKTVQPVPFPLVSESPLVLRKNPAILNPQDIYSGLGKGILASVVAFSLAGILIYLRRK